MKIQTILRKQGYDFIEGPIKYPVNNEVYEKKAFASLGGHLLFSHPNSFFESNKTFITKTKPVSDLNSTQKNEYKLDMGVKLLKKILDMAKIPLDSLNLTNTSSGVEKLSVSFSDAFAYELELGSILDYFNNGKFKATHEYMIDKANKDNLIFISGELKAKNIYVTLEFEENATSTITAEIEKGLGVDWAITTKKAGFIEMKYESKVPLILAVQAQRLRFKKGKFKDIQLVTNNLISMFK